MKPKPTKAAYNAAFRRQYDRCGNILPPPAETHQESRDLVMVVDGIRYIGKRSGGAFVWVPEDGSS